MTRANTPETYRDTVLLYDVEVEAVFKDSVTLNDVALDEEFVRIAADVGYWNARYADALKEHLLAEHTVKLERDRAMIEVRAQLRAHAAAASAPVEGKRTKAAKDVTESEVKTYVSLREDIIALELDAIAKEVEKEKMRRFADSVAVKKDALQSLGARLRIEMERDSAVRRRYSSSREAARDRQGGDDD
jgi:hypothetical protein